MFVNLMSTWLFQRLDRIIRARSGSVGGTRGISLLSDAKACGFRVFESPAFPLLPSMITCDPLRLMPRKTEARGESASAETQATAITTTHILRRIGFLMCPGPGMSTYLATCSQHLST